MDRTAALQAAHQAQAKLREAEEAIATASAVLQGWCSDRIRDPPNTLIGTGLSTRPCTGQAAGGIKLYWPLPPAINTSMYDCPWLGRASVSLAGAGACSTLTILLPGNNGPIL